MAWSDDMPTLLRYIINDVDTPQTYTDDRLTTLLLVAAQLVQSEIPFGGRYAISLDNQTLTPDPTILTPVYPDGPTRDDGFINIVTLKAGCILASSGLVKGAQQSISIADGPSRIDLTGNLAGLKLYVENFCKAYEDAKWEYVRGNSLAGEAILGPFKIGWPYTFDPRIIRRGIY